MLRDEWLLERDDVVRAVVGVECRLDLGEEDDRAVSAATDELSTGLRRGREGDCVVEGETEGLVSLLSTLVVEEVLLDVVADREECAARRVGRGVLAVGARNAAGERSFQTEQSVRMHEHMRNERTAGTLEHSEDRHNGEQSLESHGGRPSRGEELGRLSALRRSWRPYRPPFIPFEQPLIPS